jgi:hypothetical protein
VPARIFGEGVIVPGSTLDPAAAEAHARAFLARHIELLAPGTEPSDWVLVANRLDQGTRTLGLAQWVRSPDGVARVVVGGQLSFRYKADRLFVLASEAIPGARARLPLIAPERAVHVAEAWLAAEHRRAAVLGGAELVVLPLLRSGSFETRTAYRVVVAAEEPRARWAAYIDVESGAPVARDQLLRFGSAQVAFDVPTQGPQGPRQLFPARQAALTVAEIGAGYTDETGAFAWSGVDPSSVSLSPTGVRVSMDNDAGPVVVSGQLTVGHGEQLGWSLADDEFGDAQLSSFIHAQLAQDRARLIDPDQVFLGQPVTVRPNVDDPQGCNAFWDGSALNFYRQKGPCNNTARVAGVVYHEYGHGFHQGAIISGAGAMDPALGEGGADYFSATLTGDPGTARGFFIGQPNSPLRELDDGRRWPEDVAADPHETGLIVAGALWDLRQAYVAEVGSADGVALADQQYLAVLQRASNIPAAYVEVLAADDDDGNLANGTPHLCTINQAFLSHGLVPMLNARGLQLHHEALSRIAAGTNAPVRVTATELYPDCPAPALDEVKVVWGVRGEQRSAVVLALKDGVYEGEIPAQAQNTALDYQIVARAGEEIQSLPNNMADDRYRVFVGEVIPLYCTDFETDIDGWTPGSKQAGVGDFQWGEPLGVGGDPSAAFSGTKVLGNRLVGKGTYRPKRASFIDAPVVDRMGNARLRLQFRRWLTVEDGAFDEATISVNGHVLWRNEGTSEWDGSMTHRDEEWRFEDLSLDKVLKLDEPTATVRFALEADDALEFGGWTVDDLCVVAEPVVPKDDEAAGGGGAGGSEGGGAPAAVEEPTVELEAGGGCSVASSRPWGSGGAELLALGALAWARRRRTRARS